MMKVNDIVELRIDRMSYGPAAVGRIQLPGEPRAMVVFVRGAAPGEQVSAKLTKNNKSYWEAELVEVLERSPKRAEPPCPVFGRCGGCQWQHLSYESQLEAKAEILVHQLARTTKIDEAELRTKLTTHAAPSPLGYRARLQVHGDKKGIGYFAESSHKIVHTERCPIAHPKIQAAWTEFVTKRPLAEMASATGQYKIEWSVTDTGQVSEAVNRKHGAFGFTQVNPEQNTVLAGIVAELAGSGDVLLDLFGGDGNLTNALTGKFARIVSVDSFNEGEDPTSLGGPLASGRTFVKERVEDFLVEKRWLDWGVERPDCIIADPPRNGLREAAGRTAGLQAPRIILVSCDPSTLARDLTAFTSSRYRIGRIHLIDMFPQTYHMETVVELTAY
ncbi:MAG: class I SAM-dependent RNA methyltransferase [Deltaproteobacteria bacterium]|nr:class I SAM-dependent RNA methyltransferase [Deltaproteobacteria bacterium]